MHAKKLNPEDLLESIKYIGERWYSGDSIHSLSQSPIHILVYNEIIRFSKEELESIKDRYGKEVLYGAVLSTKNEFIYSALLEKKAFTHLLDEGSQWLLNQAINPSLDLYDCIYQVQSDRYKRKDEKHFISCVASYLQKMDTPEKQIIAKEFYDTYIKKHYKELIAICFDTINEPLTDYFLNRFKEDNININEENFMQRFLPTNEYNGNDNTKFFISSSLTEQIKSCLEKGFRYDEDNYDFYGKTLMTALLKSEREDLVLAILPYLKNIEPKENGQKQEKNLDSQYELLNLYKGKKDFEKIKMIFYKLVYNSYDEKFKEKTGLEPLKIKI